MRQTQPESFMSQARIRPSQFYALLSMATICANLFISPSAYLDGAGRAAWLLIIISYLAGLLLVVIAWGLARLFPDECLPEYLPRLLGRFPGRLASLFFAALLVLNAAEDTRTSMDAIVPGLFTYTPIAVLVAIVMGLSAYLAWTGHLRFARGAPLFLVIIAASVITVLILTHRWIDPGYQRPWLDFTQWRPGTVEFWAGFGTFRPLSLLVMLYPYVERQDRVLPMAALAATTATMLVGAATLATIMVFGLQGAQFATRPFIHLTAIIFFGDAPFERFDFYVRLALLTNSIFTVAFMLWSAARMIRVSVAKDLKDGPFIWGAAALAWAIQVFFAQATQWRLFAYWVMIAVFLFGLSLALLIPIALWQRQRQQRPATGGTPST